MQQYFYKHQRDKATAIKMIIFFNDWFIYKMINSSAAIFSFAMCTQALMVMNFVDCKFDYSCISSQTV